MGIEIPLTIAARAYVLPRRWLVYQAKTNGTIVYAQTFVRRSSAEKGQGRRALTD